MKRVAPSGTSSHALRIRRLPAERICRSLSARLSAGAESLENAAMQNVRTRSLGRPDAESDGGEPGLRHSEQECTYVPLNCLTYLA
jgi:hypothetical protein